jgi:hypothetical protein
VVAAAAETPQQPIVEGLRADREAVDAVAAQRAQVGLVALARVDLDGDLERPRFIRAEGGPRGGDHARERIRPPQPGRSAPEVDRHQRSGPFVPAPARRDLRDHRVRVRVVRNVGARVDGEVAIRAAHAAERKVHVDAQRVARAQSADGHIGRRPDARSSGRCAHHTTSL